MKKIEEVRAEFICPKCHKNDELAFNAYNVGCGRCNEHYDLGHKMYN